LFGTKEKFDLCSLPFSGRDSRLAIFEDGESRDLYLTISRSPTPKVERKKLIRFSPVIDNKDIPSWDYEVRPGKLTISTFAGTVEFCFAGPKRLRIRGKGRVSLRFYIHNLKTFENGSPREDGSVEVVYEVLGKLLFIPLKGSLRQDSFWRNTAARSDDFTIELIPSAETNEFEAVIHEYYSNGVRDESYPPFDRCVEEAESAFEKFFGSLGKYPDEFADFAKRAAWALWTSRASAESRMKMPAYFSSKIGLVRAVGWQQSIISTALAGDPEEAYNTLMSQFANQDELGQIPNNISDMGEDYMTAGAPMQGFAINHMLKEGVDLSPEKTEKLYTAASKYAAWWLKARCRDGSGIPQYYHPEECGWLDATVFTRGLPVKAPDLISWLVLLTEACGKLAEKLGRSEEAEKWTSESKRLLDILIKDFWKDGQFVYINAKTGFEYRANSVLRLLPVILGKRLPKKIIDALANDISDNEQYLTEGGVVSERLRSREFLLKDTSLRGGVLPVIQLLIVNGLIDAGKIKLAADIAKRVCRLADEKGAGDSIPPFAFDPGTGQPVRVEDDFDVEWGMDADRDLLKSERREPKTAVLWTAAGSAGILALMKILGKNG
jgi:putative isomerase